MKKLVTLLFMSIFGLLITTNAQALPYNEVGDAGDLMVSAQNVGANVDQISGNFFAPGGLDVDLYALFFDVTASITFDATTVDNYSPDMNMYIFNASGNPLAANDDGPIGYDSQIILDIIPGLYYLAVGENNTEALDASSNKIADNDYGVLIPDGVLGGWSLPSPTSDFATGGDYTITLSQLTAAPVPEPATMLLFGLGLLGLAGVSRKKQ